MLLAPEGKGGGAAGSRWLSIDHAAWEHFAWHSRGAEIRTLFKEITNWVLLNQASLPGRPQNIATLVFSVTMHELSKPGFLGSFYVEVKAADKKGNELPVSGEKGVFGVQEVEAIVQARKQADFLHEKGLVVSLATERNYRRSDNASSVWLTVRCRDR